MDLNKLVGVDIFYNMVYNCKKKNLHIFSIYSLIQNIVATAWFPTMLLLTTTVLMLRTLNLKRKNVNHVQNQAAEWETRKVQSQKNQPRWKAGHLVKHPVCLKDWQMLQRITAIKVNYMNMNPS